MAFDFSKLGKISQEDLARDQAQRDLVEQQKEVDLRASKAVVMKRFELTEDPEIRRDQIGGATAILRGPEFTATLKTLPNEDGGNFMDRISQISKGDEIVAHGHMDTRKWKDQSNNWRSTQEFSVDVPKSPEGLKNELLEGVNRKPSAFTLKQQQAAGLEQGR